MKPLPAHRRCRHYRSPQIVPSGGGSSTCERGIAYVDLLPTPDARGPGWVRRLPCVDLGTLPRLEGGSPCPYYLEETLAERFARHEPLRRIGAAVAGMTGEQVRALNADKPRLDAFMEQHGKPLPGIATLALTDEHVSLVCSCGDDKRTAIARTSPIECFWCGRVFEVKFSAEHGDLTLVQTKGP